MNVTCPCCATDFPIEAGFADADGKRLAARMADFEPALGRAVLAYLRLFKPSKTSLSTAQAVLIVGELYELVRSGTIASVERPELSRPASQSMWAAGVRQLLADDAVDTPLADHSALRRIVCGIAEQAGAELRATRDMPRPTTAGPRVGASPVGQKEAPSAAQKAFLRTQFEYGAIDKASYDRQIAELQAREGQS